MTKLTTWPVDAVIGALINNWDKSVFNRGLKEASSSNGYRGNVVKGSLFRNYRPESHSNAEYIIVSTPGPGRVKNYGEYNHNTEIYPVLIETHSLTSDSKAIAWANEAYEVMKELRKSIVNLYSDYRLIRIDMPPQDVSSRAVFKYVFTVELERVLQTLP